MTELTNAPLLSVRNLRTTFATHRGMLRAVDGVSFDLAAGETLGIVGESGSGKSVLVRTIMKLLPASAILSDQADIQFEGRSLRSMSPAERKHFWGPQIAMVFQDPMTSLNPVKKISSTLTESMRYHLGLSARAASERAVELLGEVGIPEPRRRMDQYPHELSGGMRQRVGIAVALACDPKLLIADEPTTALDVTVQKQILQLLARLRRDHGMAMILISHDLGVVSRMADRVAVMYAGQMVEVAATELLFAEMQHPYTEALLQSIPALDRPSHTRLQTISGPPPDMTQPPDGCRFASRCRYAQPECLPVMPPLSAQGAPGHGCRCLFPISTERGRAALAANLERGVTATGLPLVEEVAV